MRIRGCDAGVRGLSGLLALERDVSRSPQDDGRLGHECRVHRDPRVQLLDQLGVGHVLRPGDLERGRSSETREGSAISLRQRAQHADSRVQRQARPPHPGHQRDLGVPALDRAEPDSGAVAARVPEDLLGIGSVMPPGVLALLAQRSDLAQELQQQPCRRRGTAGHPRSPAAPGCARALGSRRLMPSPSRRPPCPRRERGGSGPGAGCRRPRRAVADRGVPCNPGRTVSVPAWASWSIGPPGVTNAATSAIA